LQDKRVEECPELCNLNSVERTIPRSPPTMSEVDEYVRVSSGTMFPPELVDAVTWKDKARSAKILGMGLAFYFVVNFRGWSYLSVAACATLIHMLHHLKANLSSSTPTQPPLLLLEPEFMHTLVGALVVRCNVFLEWYSDVLSGKYLFITVQVAGVLVVIWRFGSYVGGENLIFIAFLAAMLGPLVYSNNRGVFDGKLASVAAPLVHAWTTSKVQVPPTFSESGGKKDS